MAAWVSPATRGWWRGKARRGRELCGTRLLLRGEMGVGRGTGNGEAHRAVE